MTPLLKDSYLRDWLEFLNGKGTRKAIIQLRMLGRHSQERGKKRSMSVFIAFKGTLDRERGIINTY